nr:2-hydroxyisoflavanone dehydratase [Quercus suber]
MTSTTTKEVPIELLPFIRVYKNGSVERLKDTPIVPPSPDQDPETGNQKLPILVYFHGGGFFLESAFSSLYHRYLNNLVSQVHVLTISVEYRLAPEHLLPAAYEDCWAALQWVASHSAGNGKEPWLINNGDFERIFTGGDSAGANIVHNMAIRAGIESLAFGAKILVTGGVDNPMVNPEGPGAPSLAELGCDRMLVCVAGKDLMKDRGVWYFDMVRKSGWKGEVELFEVEEEDHIFHIRNIETQNSKAMVNRLASFVFE